MKEDDKPKPRQVKRSDNIIPDYDFLFKEDSNKPQKENKGFFAKLIKLNIWTIILETLFSCCSIHQYLSRRLLQLI